MANAGLNMFKLWCHFHVIALSIHSSSMSHHCVCQRVQSLKLIGGSCRVTLVVAFGFLSQNFGRWCGPRNGTLSFYEWRSSGGDTLSGGDNQNLPAPWESPSATFLIRSDALCFTSEPFSTKRTMSFKCIICLLEYRCFIIPSQLMIVNTEKEKQLLLRD